MEDNYGALMLDLNDIRILEILFTKEIDNTWGDEDVLDYHNAMKDFWEDIKDIRKQLNDNNKA